MSISTERSRVCSQTCPKQLLVRVAKSDHRKFFRQRRHSRRLQAICTAVASCFVVDRACLKFPTFYGLQLKVTFLRAQYEWRAVNEKLGKDPGSTGSRLWTCPHPWRRTGKDRGDMWTGDTQTHRGDMGHIEHSYDLHAKTGWTWGQTHMGTRDTQTHRGDMGHTLDTQRDMRRT